MSIPRHFRRKLQVFRTRTQPEKVIWLILRPGHVWCTALQLYDQQNADWPTRCYGNQVKTLIFHVIFRVFQRHSFFKVTRALRLFHSDTCGWYHRLGHEILYHMSFYMCP